MTLLGVDAVQPRYWAWDPYNTSLEPLPANYTWGNQQDTGYYNAVLRHPFYEALNLSFIDTHVRRVAGMKAMVDAGELVINP